MNENAQAPRRVLVIGVDCAAPRFVFGPDAYNLPNLRRLMEGGCHGPLESCHPPITVPAWASMTSSKDPGVLGIYGFRNRKDHSYDGMFTANAASIREPRLWDILSRQGKKVVVLGVPQTFPVKPVNGWLVSGFLAPDTNADYTYPKALKNELHDTLGEYLLDVKDFRTDDKDRLRRRVFELLDNRFAAARHLMDSKPWDFFMMVEMGTDRLHHGFWRFCDPDHPSFEPGNPYEDTFRAFYERLDAHIGDLLGRAGDDTAVMVVSDHGARAMAGGVCVNQWLINEGLLVVRDPLDGPKRIDDCDIDWSKTRAWASGGYYARIFLNVEGREEQGIIPAAEYESFRAELADRIRAMKDHEGNLLNNKVHTPEDLYSTVNGVAPDLFVYFGDLSWRSVGQVGLDSIYTFENDTGPDDANHDYQGIFILRDGVRRQEQPLDGLQLMDVAPTVLDLMGVPVPQDMQGRTVRCPGA
jgi:predicted AlkP superfamily phosphohydrolase/phosphomutase